MVVSALRPEIFLFVEFPHEHIPLLLERHVLRIPLAYISGKHPEIAVGDERQREQVKQIVSQKHGQQGAEQRHRGYKPAKLVHPVSSLHKTHKFIPHNSPFSLQKRDGLPQAADAVKLYFIVLFHLFTT